MKKILFLVLAPIAIAASRPTFNMKDIDTKEPSEVKKNISEIVLYSLHDCLEKNNSLKNSFTENNFDSNLITEQCQHLANKFLSYIHFHILQKETTAIENPGLKAAIISGIFTLILATLIKESSSIVNTFFFGSFFIGGNTAYNYLKYSQYHDEIFWDDIKERIATLS